MNGSVADSLTVVIPAYNEAGNLRATFDNLMHASRVLKGPLEVIIVNDCSTDQTHAVATSIAAENSFVRVIDKSNQPWLWRFLPTGGSRRNAGERRDDSRGRCLPRSIVNRDFRKSGYREDRDDLHSEYRRAAFRTSGHFAGLRHLHEFVIRFKTSLL